ncbi:hypothetical protein T069G_09618 [Trichoderma breve]|uniref:Uncharacterized protein n=1 Tax=Trichoderma breve TaxID=2034170 RepID=A0A9W9E3W3_9HYPO|nr:hypothetical protein T069G_09618 [Trichoderma breve]KAJ4856250.1 hypothetical protein T069G_09618 [Trichoderma breve]
MASTPLTPMDPNHLNPHFHALDIILGYLNRGNSALEIQHLSSAAEAWCQQHHPLPLNYTPVNLDEVLWTHPFLFDLSIRSFARLNSFNGCRCRSNFTQNTRLSKINTPPASLSHIRPLVTAQQFFSAMIDAYTLHVGGNGRCFHDRIVAQDLKASPIIYYIPEVIHRIAALNVCELLTSEFSTLSPKTSLGFSYHLAKAVDIVMMDAPPVSEYDALAEPMDIDDFNQEALALQNPFANVNTRANTRREKRKFASKGNKSSRPDHSRPNHSRPNHSRAHHSRPNHNQSNQFRSNQPRPNHSRSNHTQSSHSHSKQSSGVKKKRKKNH